MQPLRIAVYALTRRFFVFQLGTVGRWRRTVLIVALLAGLAPAARAGVIAQWQGGQFGDNNVLVTPPDMGAAVGDGYVMQALNNGVNFYTTSGARVGSSISLDQFWTNAGLGSAIGTTHTSDPRVVYDPASARWFASSVSTQAYSNNILLAVSKTSDPTQGFTGVSITSPGDFADYPTLGVNGAAVTVGINNFSSSTGFSTGTSLYSVPKASLIAATPSVTGYTSFHDSSNLGNNTPQPVTNATGAGTTTTVLSDNFNANGLTISTVSGANGPGASLAITGSDSSWIGTLPTAPTQPGGTSYDPGDNRLSATYQVGDSIYFANNISSGGSDKVQWGILDSLTNTLLDSGTIGVAGLDLTYPSISANANGTFVIGFNGSGSTTNISSYYAVCSAQTGTCGSPSLAYAGLASNYNLAPGGANRWGDYSTTVLDPTNPENFWLFQEMPLNYGWGTSITEIGTGSGTAVPEPPTLALFLAGMIGFGVSRRKCLR